MQLQPIPAQSLGQHLQDSSRVVFLLDSSAEQIGVPSGWTVRRTPDGWETTGPIMAAAGTAPFLSSFAWSDPDSGWALVGGDEPDAPPR